MPPALLHPGVFVFEVPSPARSIEGVPTSNTVFVGPAERGPLMPVKLTSRTDYTRQFGGYFYNNTSTNTLTPTLAYAMDAYFGNGGSVAYILRAASGGLAGAATASRSQAGPPAIKINATSPGTWANGSGTSGLFAIFLPSTDGAGTRFRVAVVYTPLDTNVQQIVEDWDRLSADPADENYVVDVLKRSLYIRWDENTAPNVPALDGGSGLTAAQIVALAAAGTALTGGAGGNSDPAIPADYQLNLLDDIDDASLLVLPSFKTDGNVVQLNNHGIGYVEGQRPMRDMFYIGTLTRQSGQVLATNATQLAAAEYAGLPKSNFAAIYWPWVKVADPVGKGRDPQVPVSPASAMAGLYARTDNLRGVWKAPAGVESTVLGARSVEFNIQDVQQDVLNPIGVNAIRLIASAGIVLWGSRTMQPASEWRYVPVRRTAMYIRKSIYKGIQFAVFEGNDEPLWATLRLVIGSFMDSMYRNGAFAGRSPKDAYFVKCDAETTTPADQIAGVVNVLVGFSPLRPAEFVVVKLSQIVQQSA